MLQSLLNIANWPTWRLPPQVQARAPPRLRHSIQRTFDGGTMSILRPSWRYGVAFLPYIGTTNSFDGGSLARLTCVTIHCRLLGGISCTSGVSRRFTSVRRGDEPISDKPNASQSMLPWRRIAARMRHNAARRVASEGMKRWR